MNRCSFCEWIPILPWPVWPLAGHARLGQNTVVGSMTILLSWLCWGACQEEVCLDPRFLCNLTLPRLSVELPGHQHPRANHHFWWEAGVFLRGTGRRATRIYRDEVVVLHTLRQRHQRAAWRKLRRCLLGGAACAWRQEH